MGVYEYVALDKTGLNKKGLISADNAKNARQELRDQGLYPVSLLTQNTRAATKTSGTASRHKLGDSDLSVLTRQFSILLSSGLTIEDCFNALIKQEDNHQTKAMLSNIRGKVMEGHTLTHAFRRYPRTFSELYVSTVEAGEQSGRLAEVMEGLAGYIEERVGISQRISTALVYPVILMIVSILIVVGLVTYVVPKVVSVFEDTGQELPWLTRGLIALSDFIRENGSGLLLAILVVLLAWIMVFRREAPKRWLHGRYLTTPGIKKLSRGLNAARMARTLSIMLNSGVPLLTAMDAASKVISNLRMQRGLRQAAVEVTEGVSLNRALERAGCFPPLMVQMIQSGEASGRLPEMLEKSASVMERDIESRIAIVVSLFEPFMILFMGVIVLMIVLAILLPIFDLNQIIV
ncbi:MAG: type II secretion system protein F [marine bacterium B5-7]|nr:MAG: type II secretion system protein F [marine bacterium B5-7]